MTVENLLTKKIYVRFVRMIFTQHTTKVCMLKENKTTIATMTVIKGLVKKKKEM